MLYLEVLLSFNYKWGGVIRSIMVTGLGHTNYKVSDSTQLLKSMQPMCTSQCIADVGD